MDEAVKHKVALLLNREMAERVIGEEGFAFLRTWATFQEPHDLPEVMTIDYMQEHVKQAEACITCWGTPGFNEKVLAEATDLKLIAHAAGSVKWLVSDGVWARKIRVTSAAPVIAADVAETTLGLIIISLKRIWSQAAFTKAGGWRRPGESDRMKRLKGLTVGVIAASSCGRNLIKLLQPFEVKILLYDPFVSAVQAEALGAQKVTLEELMAASDVVTLHAPDLPANRHMINAQNLALLKDNSLFINTARGALVDEEALVAELKTGRFFACLDVTEPEPPAEEHPLRHLENVILTPHIAGGHTVNGRREQGAFILEQIYKFFTVGSLDYEVTKAMLGQIA